MSNRETTSRCIRVLAVGLLGAVLAAATGCSEYVTAPRRYSEFGSRIQVELPRGWLQHTKAKDGFTITKDGLRLEKITIRIVRLGEKLKETDRIYTSGMMPNDAADLSVGLVKARPDIRNFEVASIDAAQFAGRDGYRVDAMYIDEGGLIRRMRMYGAVLDRHVCELTYEAAEPVYFQKYEGDFQKMVASVRVGR
jgi:hypothetical protein